MVAKKHTLIGRGVYSLPEASRLTRIPRSRLRRWLEGYAYTSSGRTRRSPRAVVGDINRRTGALALSFADLIEVRMLDRFLDLGVSWRSIRIAAARAAELMETSHPFSTKVFKSDGRTILLEISAEGGLGDLLDLVADQWEMTGVVGHALYAGIEFSADNRPDRWYPMTRKSSVVIDPARSFGAPIIDDAGVPTAVLANAAKAEGSQRAAADWFRVPVRAVRHAVEFERRYGRGA